MNLRRLLAKVSWLLATLIGEWRWRPPTWLAAVGRGLAGLWQGGKARPKHAAAVGLTLVGVSAALIWYTTRPTPHYVEYTVAAPGLTEYNENGISSIKTLRVDFKEPVAQLKQTEKAVTTGISLTPGFAGTWVWNNDKQLEFKPKDDWPIDVEFKVGLKPSGLLASRVRLKDYSFAFKSQPFAARITDSQFYQDPRDPNLKKLVATVQFSHPVDADQFERKVSLAVAKDAEYLGLKPDSRNFTLLYDKFKLAAHVHSTALAMPRDDTPMTLKVDKGVRAARGGNDTRDRLESIVTIPGRASLKFSGAEMTVVDNARYEPEQILLLTSSSPVDDKALGGKVSGYVLPLRHPTQPKEDEDPFEWDDATQIGAEILAKSDPLTLTDVPSEEGGNTTHSLRFRAPVGRYIYIAVKDGVQGIGGYVSAKPYVATMVVTPYPQALTFLGQGALLSLSGDKKVGFLARDVDKVEVEVGRLLPNQLQHVAPSMWEFARPHVGEDMEASITERFTSIRDFTGVAPGKPSYDSIDLGQYLEDKAQGKRGLFLLRLRSMPESPHDGDGASESEGDGEEDGPRPRTIQDQRLILVTDLGLIVKTAKDGSRGVFVQSIRTGLPIEGARIEVLGRNGLPVQVATSDATGLARLPKLPDLKREKAPLMFLAQKDDDFSFMPFRTNDRTLNVSRFDTGGVENAESAGQLSSYLFSDRGIYRPGETTHIGIVTRTADWGSSAAGLPIDVEITDPRGALVSRQSLKLSDKAFDAIDYTSQPSSPTGTYEATAYLVKDEKHKDRLGTSSFKVQEFEPDRMKVQLTLADQAIEGWLSPTDVKARLAVLHLFGEPASNRRVEGELSLTAVLPQFSRFADHRFQIGQTLTEPYHETLASTMTDDKGSAAFSLDLQRFVGRAYRLNVLARAFEAEGGRNVAAQDSVIVSDAPFLVGVKADGDLSFVRRATTRTAHWLAVNRQLAPVAADALTLEWVQRKFVSVLTQQGNNTYRYVSRLKEVVRDAKAVTIAVGGSNFPLPTAEPGDFMMVLRNAAGTELNRLSYSVAGQANLSRSLERNAELQIQLDKPTYSGGDTIEVSIRAPYVGAGLITVEREHVFLHQWFKTSTTSSVQRVTLPRDFEGNGYISVQFLRDPASDELFMSPLSYGVAPFSANLSPRTQQVTLTVAKQVKPGATLTLRLASSEPSRVAVLAVDEGILQVARYKNPDPLGYFFQKRMLEVDTSQILDLILPEFKRFLALAAPGGDADGGFARHLNPFNKKRKPPVAYWSGLVDVGPAGRELKYVVPDYFNGRLRVVAIGVSARRVGVSEATTEVKGDFILTPNLPAMVAPGDEFAVSVGVFNNTSGATGAIQVDAQVGPELTAQGPLRLELQIPDKKEGVAEFRFKANAALGAASLKFVARRAASQAQVDESLSVRPAVAYRTQLTLGRLDSRTTQATLTREMYAERRKVEASASSLPLVWGQGLIAYLDSYAYSCTEQLVSKGMAALLLMARPEFGVIKSPDAQPLASTFSVLQSRQNDAGGLGLWSSSPETAEFPTVYGAHFLVEAKERGQKIPAETLVTLGEWLTRFAATPASSLGDARLRAYAVYLLARQGIKPVAALSNVEQELTRRYPQTWSADLAAAYLAATYRLMQRNDDADRLIRSLPWSSQKKDWGEEIYYDPVGHDAQLLYLLARHFPNRLGASSQAALEAMSRAVSDNRVNSLSAAYTLLALDAYAKAVAPAGKVGIAEIAKDGRVQALTLPAGAMPKVSVSTNAAKLEFSKEGPLTAYFSVSESGFDRQPPVADLSQGIEVIREFIDAKGAAITSAKVGEEFLVRLRLRSTTRDRQRQIAVVDLLPGGVEAVLELQPPADSRTPNADPAMSAIRARIASLPIGLADKSTWAPHHVDVREDRVLLYGDATKDAATFVYRVRAVSAGVFQVPPAFAEAMYDRKVVGVGLAGRLEIVKP